MQYIKDDQIYSHISKIVSGNTTIINPTHEQILSAEYEVYELIEEPPTTYQPTYEEAVEMAIRERYSMSDELAILRQRDTKPDEFNEYFEFCEGIKAQLKSETI